MTKDQIREILATHQKWIEGEADGKRAYLGGAYIRGANLSDADLRDANLSNATLSGANLGGATNVIALGQPNGWWAFAYLWQGEIWLRVGCRTKSLADARSYWADKGARREVMATIDYAEAIARLRGWEFKA